MHTLDIILLADFLSALLLAALMILLILKVAYSNRLFDIPNERKVHEIPVPRLGGVSFLPTIVVVCTFTIGVIYSLGLTTKSFGEVKSFVNLTYLLGGAILLFIVGLADDLADVGFKIKFAVQFLVALVIVASGMYIHNLYGLFGIHELPDFVGITFTILLLIFITNAINLIDGIDGLASGIVAISLVCFCVIYVFERKFVPAMVSLTTLGAVSVFWLFNIFGTREKKTKLFMGDTGSLLLGLILCYLIINLGSFIGHNGPTRNTKYYVIAFSSLMIPLLDVIRVMGYRIIKHKSPFLPDMNHIHHLLLKTGFSTRKALFTLLGIDIFLIALNALLCRVINVNILFVLDIALYCLLIWYIDSKKVTETL